MDWASVLQVGFDTRFLAAVLSIVIIDLVLAGDNAVVIAMAVRNLPSQQRRQGIIAGAGAAVALRVAATFFVSQILRIGLVKLAGGVAILWIGVKLFVDGMPEEGTRKEATTIWQAIRLIVIADITLSIDNMLAVGGASHGNLFLLLFGLAVSVPFVVFASGVLSRLMDRHPGIVTIGAAILGKVGAEMVISDPWIAGLVHLPKPAEYIVQAFGAAAVVIVGRLVIAGARLRTGSAAAALAQAPGSVLGLRA